MNLICNCRLGITKVSAVPTNDPTKQSSTSASPAKRDETAGLGPIKVTRLTAIGGLVVMVMAVVTEMLVAFTKFFGEQLPKLTESLQRYPEYLRWPFIGGMLGICLFAWYRTRPKPSRLIRPEQFDLDPSVASETEKTYGTQ